MVALAKLKNHPLFADFTPAELGVAAKYFSNHTYEAGETIQEAHDNGEKLHIILAGGANSEASEQAPSASLSSGEASGYLSFFGSGQHQVTLTAADSGCECLVLERADFDEMERILPSSSSKLIATCHAQLLGDLTTLTGELAG